MATKRASIASAVRASSQLTRLACPQAARSFATASPAPRITLRHQTARPTACVSRRQLGIRWLTESATGSKIYNFEEIRSLAGSKKSTEAIIIDVREPNELSSTGRIPGALNIPITTAPDSFHIGADEFADRFGFERPAQDAELVFYCKAGVRSRAAAGIAREAGWTRVGEYPGSWVDWSGKGGEIERS